MEKNNRCLKNGFIFFYYVFGVFGILFICLLCNTGTGKVMDKLNAPIMTTLWVFAVSLVIFIFGRCTTWTKSKSCLIAFAVITGIGMVVMIIFGINVAVFKSQYMERAQSPDFAQEKELENLQKHRQCCGWTGVEHWGSEIPDSCACKPSSEQCEPRPQGSTGPLSVYSKSCGKIKAADVEHLANIFLGIFFGFAVAAMMCLIIAIKMIKQISRHDNIRKPDIEMRNYES